MKSYLITPAKSVTGPSVNSEFSQQVIISITHVLCKAKLLQRNMKLPKFFLCHSCWIIEAY